ncbi:MAG: ABC transporter ATP-binding protein/permease [Oscillospiraceae bacterium]|nr:ABC transporter ATP-binding protein/permease [Oscillospiraceae bacterium]
MLRLSGITKDYKVADTKVQALKGLDLSFRENEFVSILGPSGCGKTTLLNIVGGLDHCTTGDLFIGGVSTKKFKDKDWDVYRNRRVGFIFQSYNLIPHQTVLGNVELALTIAGISKAERTAKALKALEKVGLKDQAHKRPNQLSGGQCQRVAIARALVNDPEILLADEPTGALDTKTSIQIMELIKEIAKEKLVIMVTHNPELAEQYSSRIIKLLDGRLQNDTNPYTPENESTASKPAAKSAKAKMSAWTAFKLSLQNLISKRTRTIMTSVAGSIGIIGVSVVLSISFGMQTFIGHMQNDMLSGNPIRITQTGMNLGALIGGSGPSDRVAAVREAGYVNVNAMVDALAARASFAENIMLENHITREYIDFLQTMPPEYVAEIFFNYGLDVTNNIFTDFREYADSEPVNMSLAAIRNMYASVLRRTPHAAHADHIINLTNLFNQLPQNEEYILTQYDLLYGRMASEKGDVVVVLQDNSVLNDLLFAQLGYYTQEEFLNIVFRTLAEEDGSPNEHYIPEFHRQRFSYQDIVGQSFAWYPNDVVFEMDENSESQFFYHATRHDDFRNGVQLTVVGILAPREGSSYGSLESAFYYTHALARHIIDVNTNSEIVTMLINNEQESTSSGDTASGLMDDLQAAADGVERLSEGTAQLGDGLDHLLAGVRQLQDGTVVMVDTLSEFMAELENVFRSNPLLMLDPNIRRMLQSFEGGDGETLDFDQLALLDDSFSMLAEGIAAIQGGFAGLDEGVSQLSDGLGNFLPGTDDDIRNIPPVSITFQYSYSFLGERFEDNVGFLGNQAPFVAMAGGMVAGNRQLEEMARVRTISLQQLGGVDMPHSISIFAADFEQKEFVLQHLDRWNADESLTFFSQSQGQYITIEADQRDEIIYTDALSLIVAMINSLINIVTFALIGFTSLALVVSCVMIGIITYVSVVERIKEIGVIRSLGGRKRDVSNLFTAETFIIGLFSGLIGIGVTFAISFFLNLIIWHLEGIRTIAIFPWFYAVMMVSISVFLTLASGLLPSRSAAKKDPVVALRTE